MNEGKSFSGSGLRPALYKGALPPRTTPPQKQNPEIGHRSRSRSLARGL